ncbi:EmrB/QacA subfamily drug resistance transporter [Microbacterium sp. SORGH_AS 1204]|uniref:MFS transporter n=1 Tax=Microbacterium sp. SORGH_AS_1204 TaxID=3041785 RepID=UPI002792794F|nr:MFS transporter [Microbacterium sp. SORGH_AS_1204]MDQ1138190.1 EmrB/QacA subfamily drug resistance transporter [Microbacterium sp. SORGH_AS_1204]
MTDSRAASAASPSSGSIRTGSFTTPAKSPWPALWALVIGFFMILVDTTIVSVANPAIKAALDPNTNNLDNVVWVTSAYLLTYAVPLLITGRLGDRFGPKNVYLAGLALFTLASLACGLSSSLEMLIVARAVQGLGAALVTPQTMAVITRTFPPQRRGAAMGLWGATAGVAVLVGPLAGGLLVDGLGWEWIFFINIPVGVIGFIAALILVPQLPRTAHKFDILGVVLSAIGLFLIVFGLQEGEHYAWAAWIWLMVAAGVVVMGVFIWTQRRTGEPLVPLELFRDRNFSVANLAIAAVGFTVTSMALPQMFYLQLARGLTPTEAALLLVPLAILSGVLAPFAGKLLDRTDPRFLLVPGLLLVAGSLGIYVALILNDAPIWAFLIPSALMGVGNAGMWGPLATTATRNLPPRQAGAGAGIYNTTRTVGSVIGSASIAAFMQARLEANLPGAADASASFGGGSLPPQVVQGFSQAMGQSLLLPVAVIVVGLVAVLFMRRPSVIRPHGSPRDAAPAQAQAAPAAAGE